MKDIDTHTDIWNMSLCYLGSLHKKLDDLSFVHKAGVMKSHFI